MWKTWVVGTSPATGASIQHSPNTGDFAVSIALLTGSGNAKSPLPRAEQDRASGLGGASLAAGKGPMKACARIDDRPLGCPGFRSDRDHRAGHPHNPTGRPTGARPLEVILDSVPGRVGGRLRSVLAFWMSEINDFVPSTPERR